MGTFGRFTLNVSAAAVALAGCGSLQAPMAQNAALPATARSAASKFAGEKFSSTYVTTTCLLTPGGPQLNYTATGSASGPLPGTFSASGSVLYDGILKTFSFYETFDVKSGTETFAGKVKQSQGAFQFSGCTKDSKGEFFSAKRVRYGVDGSRGNSSIDYAKLVFDEKFY